MIITSCYNCGSERNSFSAEENGYVLVRCASCGLLFVENPPDAKKISEAHRQGKHGGVNELDVTGSFKPAKVSQYLKILRKLYGSELLGEGAWLDVGCGHGEFMLAVQKFTHGRFAVRGTDPNDGKSESARSRGLNVHFMDLESHGLKYNVISLLNVYSHLPDPPNFLESVKGLLLPEGCLIVETGDTAGISDVDLPRPLLLPDHLSFATEEIVVGMLESMDFAIEKIVKVPFMRNDVISIAKEFVKAVLPRHQSRLRYYLKWEIPKTDMYIRAKLKS